MKSRVLLVVLASIGLSTAAFAGSTQTTTTSAAKTATAKHAHKVVAQKHCAKCTKHATTKTTTAPITTAVTPANINTLTTKELANKKTVLTVNTQDLTQADFANALIKKAAARTTRATFVITDAAQGSSKVVAGPSAARYFSSLKTKTNQVVMASDLAKSIGLTHVKACNSKNMSGSFVEII